MDGQYIFVSFKFSAHILGFNHLGVEFAAERADEHVQPKEKTAHWGQFFMVVVRECIGDLFTG